MSPACPPDALVVESVRFAAGPYRLEGELAYAEGLPPRAAAVLAGPHPLLGGDLHNNVVRGVGDGLAGRGVVTLRFNYRGVGRSEGPAVDVAVHLAEFWQTSHVPDEHDHRTDLDGAVAFLRGAVGAELPLALVGYSFGCSLLPHARTAGRAAAFVLIAPTVTTHNYDAFWAVREPTLVIASEDDFATDADRLRRWFERIVAPKQLVQGPLDNHFFRGHEPWLAATAAAFLDAHGR
jgi:alpha/beta superfamily hydrolase